jgi:hypothetical protein
MTRQTHDLKFSDVDLVQAFLASSAPLKAERLPEERLVRFAFGWSSESDEEAVLEALTQSGSLRQDLIAIRKSLKQPEARSRSVGEFLDYAISSAAGALGAMERGLSDWKSSFEGNLVVQHFLSAQSDRLAQSSGGVAWARSGRSPDQTRDAESNAEGAVDSVLVDTDRGTPTTLTISRRPIARNGEIELALDFDSRFLSEYADQTLELFFAAGPLNIPLRAWKVIDLPVDGYLSAPIPSSLVGPVPRAAIGLSLSAAP